MPDTDKIRFLTGRQADLSLQPVVRGQVYFAINGNDGQIVFDAPIDASTTRRIIMSNSTNLTDRAQKDSAGNEFISKYPFKFTTTSTGTSFQINALAFNDDAVSGSPITIAVADATHAGIITNAAQDITGLKTFKTGITIDAAGGFEYSGIQTNSTNSARSIWFSDSTAAGKPTINADFTYNPSTKTLVAENITGTATKAQKDSAGNEFITKYPYSFTTTSDGTSFKINVLTYSGDNATGSPVSVAVADATHAGIITNAAQTIAGTKTFSTGVTVSASSGFNYSGIESASSNSARPVWFAHDGGVNGKPVYNDNFTYNPSTQTLNVQNVNGIAEKAKKDSADNEFISTYPFTLSLNTAQTSIVVKAQNNDTLTTLSPAFLPLAGGTMTGDITFQAISNGDSYPVKAKKITWSGSTDAADIYYQLDASDAGRLIFNMRDDTNAMIGYAYNGTVKAWMNPSTPSFYPASNNTGSIGTSGNKWANIYATNFNGLATQATQDSAGNEFISKYPFLFQETTSTTTYKINIKAPNGDTVQVKNTSGTLVNELTVPGATTSVAGLVTTGAQTWSGVKNLQATGDAGITVENTTSGKANKMGFINGNSGNSGVYSYKHSKWIAYVDLSGNSYFKGTSDVTDAVNSTPATGDNEFTHAWFSYGTSAANEKKRAYDNSYKYNSGTHTLNVTQYRINDHGLISYDANTESIVFSFV